MPAQPIDKSRTRVLLVVPGDGDRTPERAVLDDRTVEVVARAHTIDSALALERTLEPHVIVVAVDTDADMAFAERLQGSRNGATRPLVLVFVGAAPDAICAAFKLAAATIVPAPSRALRRREAAHDDELTRREREVLQLAAAGLSNAAIARTLWVSNETVKSHLASTYRKLGVRGRRDAAAAARTLGYLDVPDEPAKAAPMVSV